MAFISPAQRAFLAILRRSGRRVGSAVTRQFGDDVFRYLGRAASRIASSRIGRGYSKVERMAQPKVPGLRKLPKLGKWAFRGELASTAAFGIGLPAYLGISSYRAEKKHRREREALLRKFKQSFPKSPRSKRVRRTS